MQNISQPNQFHGNISEDMPLVNIFEQIAANQKYGWVFLKYPQQEVCLYFQGDLVGLVTPPEKKLEYIPEKLYHAGVLSEEDYQAVMSSDDPLSTLESKVPEEEIDTMLHNICYDEICSLLARYEGYFEFIDQNHPEANPELTPIGRMFDSEGILMEATNRQREWTEMCNSLPDWDEMLITAEDVSYPPSNDPMGNILHLADYRNFREILLFSYFHEFDTLRMLGSLLADGRLRLLEDQELRSSAAECEAREEWEAAIGYYHVLFKRQPSDLTICESLVNCYEKTDRKQDLSALCQTVAHHLLALPGKNERNQGAMYLKKYIQQIPDTAEEVDARLQLFELVIRQHVDSKTIEYNVLIEGNSLLQMLRSRKEDNRARELLENLLAIAPHDKNLQSQYINVCLDLKDVGSAVAQYDKIAKIYDRDHNWPELAATYQKIIRLLPSRKDIVKKLEDLKVKKIRRKTLPGRKMAMVFALVVLVLGGGIGYHFYQKAQQAKTTDHTNDNAIVRPPETDAIGDILKGIDDQAKKLVDDALQAKKEGKIDRARELLKEASYRKPSNELERKIETAGKEVDEFVQGFKTEMAAIRSRIDDNWEGSLRKYKYNIMQREEYAELAKKERFELPVTVRVTPQNANFTVDGEPAKKINDRLFLSPEFQKLEVSLPGYRSCTYNNPLSDDSGGKYVKETVQVELEKVLQWVLELDSGEAIGAPGLYREGILYLISGSNVKIYAFQGVEESSPPKLKWKWEPSAGKSRLVAFTSSPYLYENTLYAIETNGLLDAIDIEDGKLTAQYQIPGGTSSSVDSTPSVYAGEQYRWLLFTAADQKVYAFPLHSGEKKFWPLTGDVRSAPIVAEDLVIAGTSTRALDAFSIVYDKKSRGPKKKDGWKSAQAKVRIQTQPLVDAGTLYLTAGRYLYSAQARDGKNFQIMHAAAASINNQPFIKEGNFYFTTTDKICALSPQGSLLWESEDKEVQGKFSASPVVSSQNILYVASENGTFYALHAKTGKLKWKKSLKEKDAERKVKFSLPPLLIGNTVIQAADSLYAFLDG